MIPLRAVIASIVVAFATFASLDARTAVADSFLVFKDDRGGFTSSLDDASSSVTDSGGAFAPDPGAGSAASVARSGLIGGQAYAYTLYDFDFANSPSGTLTPGAAGGDIADTDNLTVESPAAQGGATGAGTWGIDAGTGQTSTRNALLAHFSTTPGGLGVGHFGVDLVDFEIPVGSLGGTLRLYDGGILIFSHSFDWGGTTGDAETHFIGVVAVADGGGQAQRFDQAVLVIGTNTDSYAADRLTFGAAIHNPEPGTLALFGLGAAGLAVIARRRAARRNPDVSSPASDGGSEAPRGEESRE
jgi:hypothetical protein